MRNFDRAQFLEEVWRLAEEMVSEEMVSFVTALSRMALSFLYLFGMYLVFVLCGAWIESLTMALSDDLVRVFVIEYFSGQLLSYLCSISTRRRLTQLRLRLTLLPSVGCASLVQCVLRLTSRA